MSPRPGDRRSRYRAPEEGDEEALAWDDLPLGPAADEGAPERAEEEEETGEGVGSNLSLFGDGEAAPARRRRRAGSRGATSESHPPVAGERDDPEWRQPELLEREPAEREAAGEAEPEPPVAPPPAWEPAPLFERAAAGVADLTVHLAALVVVGACATLIGVTPEGRLWPGFLGFLLSFSFLYTTLPLAFWGQTPGMAWRDLRARDHHDQPLTFAQTALRWIAWLVTTSLIGLPGLMAIRGGSFADRLSASETYRRAS